MSEEESNAQQSANAEEDDEPDEWDKRIFSTGCAGKFNADRGQRQKRESVFRG
ncbi:hypothetical protein ACHAO7_001505 [Fusarium culmorum]